MGFRHDGRLIGGNGEEVDASANRQRPGEVREKDETPPKHADQVQIFNLGVVFRDSASKFPDAS